MSESKSDVPFREIQDFPAYRVGSDGTVWSRWKIKSLGHGHGSARVIGAHWRKLKPQRMNVYGHLQVGLYPGPLLRLVHHLVLEAFVGPCPAGMECRHLDGDPRNNRLENLCWGTHAENVADMARHGTRPQGERHGSVVLTEARVRAIRIAYATGSKTCRELGIEHGVSGSGTIWRIVRRKTWRHVL